jgi:ParB/RepB/Spo0J family partition protein
MNDQGNGDHPRIELVDVSKINAGGNVRADLGNLHELAATFDNGEPTQPPVVVENGEGGYDLVVGQRRLAAMVLSGKTKVHVQVAPERPKNLRLVQARENLARKALNPLEEARVYAELLADYDGHQGKLAERLGVSQATISRRLALLELAEPVLEMVEDGTLAASHAEEIVGSGLGMAEQARVSNDLRTRSKITVNVVKIACRGAQVEPEGADPKAPEAVEPEREERPKTEREQQGVPLAPRQDCPFYKQFYDAGDYETDVALYQTLQDILPQVMEIRETGRFGKMSPKLREYINHVCVNLGKELRVIEEMTR